MKPSATAVFLVVYLVVQKKIPEDIIPNRDRKGDEKAKKSIRFSDLK